MYRVLNRTQKALLATTMLYSMDGELPTYGEVVVYANAIEGRVRDIADLEPSQMINRRHAQDARAAAVASLHMQAPDLPAPGSDMVVESLLFVRPPPGPDRKT